MPATRAMLGRLVGKCHIIIAKEKDSGSNISKVIKNKKITGHQMCSFRCVTKSETGGKSVNGRKIFKIILPKLFPEDCPRRRFSSRLF